MILGDQADWDDLFDQQLVPVVMTMILTTWDQMQKPGPSEHEDAISDKLYGALLKAKNRNKHPFLIRREDIEFDIEQGRGTGRKDIVFYPSSEEEIYLCIEAKRLNVIISSSKHSLAGEYVKEGMQRFVDGKYARSVRHGVMLAYVLDGKIDQAISNIESNIVKYRENLRLSSKAFIPSAIRPQDNRAKETHHKRAHEHVIFRIHHLFVN